MSGERTNEERTGAQHCRGGALIALVTMAMLLTGCVTPGAVDAQPTPDLATAPPSATPAPLPPGADPIPGATWTPEPPVSLADVEGYEFVAVSASDPALRWIAARRFGLSFSFMNSTNWLAVFTPCNALNGPYVVTEGRLVYEVFATGAMGCLGTAAEQERWIVQFLQQGPSLVASPEGVILSTDDARVEFARTS